MGAVWTGAKDTKTGLDDTWGSVPEFVTCPETGECCEKVECAEEGSTVGKTLRSFLVW